MCGSGVIIFVSDSYSGTERGKGLEGNFMKRKLFHNPSFPSKKWRGWQNRELGCRWWRTEFCTDHVCGQFCATQRAFRLWITPESGQGDSNISPSGPISRYMFCCQCVSVLSCSPQRTVLRGLHIAFLLYFRQRVITFAYVISHFHSFLSPSLAHTRNKPITLNFF